MKKQFVIMGIIVILVIIGLSGCQDLLTFNNTDKVQLVDYIVETYYNYGTYFTEKLGDGFVHNSSYTNRCYIIRGSVKNIAGEQLKDVVITLNFYDKNNNFLVSRTETIPYLDSSETENFELIYYELDPYFDDIDDLKFVFTVS